MISVISQYRVVDALQISALSHAANKVAVGKGGGGGNSAHAKANQKSTDQSVSSFEKYLDAAVLGYNP